MKPYVHTKTYTQIFIALFTTAKMWKEPRCLSNDDGGAECGVPLQRDIMWPKARSELLIHATTRMNPERS